MLSPARSLSCWRDCSSDGSLVRVRSYSRPTEWRSELAHTSICVGEPSAVSSCCAFGEPQLSKWQSPPTASKVLLVATIATVGAVPYKSVIFYRRP